MTPTVRTFRAPDTNAALAAVKAALGSEAVILSTRSVDAGMFRRAEVEITAALGQAEEDLPRPRPRPRSAAAAVAAHALAAGQPAPRAAAPLPAPRPPPVRPEDDPVSDELRSLRRSVEEARKALATVTREARAGRDLQLPPAAAEIHARLTGRGVEPALAEGLVRSALASTGPDAQAILAAVRDLLGERLVPCRAPWLHESRHVIAVVGPTGVGKTTTLAKMAARAILEAKKRVAFVTLDTYRIGATEQLARYGEIMGAPVLVARDRGELARAMERVADVDLVLVDTAGRSTPEDVARQAALVRTIPRVQLHLVVSAATGASELAAVADRYRALQPDRLVVSKVDEAAGPGGILSASVRICRPISCVADGQRVPEDLHALTGSQLVDLVAGPDDAA
ncbi:MAG: flagellar biosynthesis protein FlhF [Anaeromyxobacter sp.]|nr:flagellar biosynthesis protein FlhF [Anaeromyxobacter sp.]MBL0276171.1 flagellar biosynthesis protein FlhF [Anaeromyxobacter sp.]